jgi:outer membrane biosynthesis protein TonB
MSHDGYSKRLSLCAANGRCFQLGRQPWATGVAPLASTDVAPATRCRGAAQKRRETATTYGADSATPSSAPTPRALLATPCRYPTRADAVLYSVEMTLRG